MTEQVVRVTTQRIIVNPAGNAVAVIQAGPVGPAGPQGIPGTGEVSAILTVDGQMVTRDGGVLVPITRAALANDAAFTGKYIQLGVASADGNILTRTAPGVIGSISRTALALDAAWTFQYMPLGILSNDGDVLTRIGGSPGGITRENLSLDTAWLNRYAPNNRIVDLKQGTATSWTNATTTQSDITVSAGSAPSISVALSTAKRYKMVFTARFGSTVSGDTMQARFVEGGVDRKGGLLWVTNATALTLHHEWIFIPASGSTTTYKVMGQRVSGSGTISMSASATSPMEFWIEDMGRY